MLSSPLSWETFYQEGELYKASIHLLIRSLFQPKKGRSQSLDGKNLYQTALHWPGGLIQLHQKLISKKFNFQPGKISRVKIRGKNRDIAVFPWEDRIVDILLYRKLNEIFRDFFLPQTFAYRPHTGGVNGCQRKIQKALKGAGELFIRKGDIKSYFATIPLNLLLKKISFFIQKDDFLIHLIKQRIFFQTLTEGKVETNTIGLPFGSPLSCFLSNLFLDPLDRLMVTIPDLKYFRYSDDFIWFSQNRDSVLHGETLFQEFLRCHEIKEKEKSRIFLFFGSLEPISTPISPLTPFISSNRFRHLGLEYRFAGPTGLSREKSRKICNLFKRNFRFQKKWIDSQINPEKRVKILIKISRNVLEKGVKNIGIIDYYLKHIEDEGQINRIDRWLAEEVLATGLQRGHKKGNFKVFSFQTLRKWGLPSLLHRGREIKHGNRKAPFFRGGFLTE